MNQVSLALIPTMYNISQLVGTIFSITGVYSHCEESQGITTDLIKQQH